jgi:hypothetical protein
VFYFRTQCMPAAKFHATVVIVEVLPMCTVETFEFSLVCFWLELQHFFLRQISFFGKFV